MSTQDCAEYPSLTKEIVSEILEITPPYTNDEEKEICRRLVEEGLTAEEQHIAASTSYAFWFATTYFEDNDKPSSEVCIRMAMREARRHLVGLVGASGDVDETTALTRLKDCCQFRKERHFHLLRSCYPLPPNSGFKDKEGTPGEEEIKAQFRSSIEEDLGKQQFYVRGKDRDSRAVAIKMGRISPETNHEAYVTAQLYVAERVIASTEFLSRGSQEKIVLVMDFEAYSSSNAPPLLTMKESIGMCQRNFPERLKKAVITEPAFWMRGIHSLLYPLMDTDTRDKLQMAYGEGKHEIIRPIIAPEQAVPFMMPEAQLDVPFDVHKFLKEVPFHCPFDSSSSHQSS